MPQIEPGTVVLDKYRVVRTLGIGGMGMVVHAVHTTLGNDVAIKFLLPQFSTSGDAARRFVREAQAASKIQCEHIARVSDVGSGPLGPYMVMEFLEGQDLSKQIKQFGPLSIPVALDYAVQAATALSEAHRHGIIHRDVKPANLFVVERSDGSPLVKVLDFGISKVAEQSSLDVTKTTAILGSGLYMSPEQMKSSKSVDARADVYALGVSLYEMLTGTQPHVADNFPDLVMKVNMDPPDPLRRHRPDVPEELAQAIEKSYARKPDDRYASMLEFAQALAPWSMPETRGAVDAIARPRRGQGGAAPRPRCHPPSTSRSERRRLRSLRFPQARWSRVRPRSGRPSRSPTALARRTPPSFRRPPPCRAHAHSVSTPSGEIGGRSRPSRSVPRPRRTSLPPIRRAAGWDCWAWASVSERCWLRGPQACTSGEAWGGSRPRRSPRHRSTRAAHLPERPVPGLHRAWRPSLWSRQRRSSWRRAPLLQRAWPFLRVPRPLRVRQARRLLRPHRVHTGRRSSHAPLRASRRLRRPRPLQPHQPLRPRQPLRPSLRQPAFRVCAPSTANPARLERQRDLHLRVTSPTPSSLRRSFAT
jgi:serine/threonine protein kinase